MRTIVVRRSSGSVLATSIAITLLVTTAMVEVFLAGDAARRVLEASGGWINDNLVFFAVLGAVVIGGVLRGMGGLRPEDLGLEWRQLRQGVWTLVGLWVAIQLLAATASLATGRGVTLNGIWAQHGPGTVLGFALAMVLGTALFEEVYFRGNLLPQLALRMGGVLHSDRGRLAAAVLACAVIFALWHLPTLLLNRSLAGAALAGSLANMFIGGVLLSLVYLRTANLFVAIAVHALVNAPTLLPSSPLPGSLVAGILGLVLLVAWPVFVGRPLRTPLARFAGPGTGARGEGRPPVSRPR